ncbi:glycyl radical protein [Olsenella sp. YH-ols2217]|uniref:Glycyl radical protein n=1 Tax=Kribbibacterium absianum TaxID=3044210 RepID=A0ABT6ZK65_9ACTN|nr:MULTISPECIES: glycyl radical protein [unclassified Olsenella]MDJ1122588.1 glycyl radical protein [Olsenella sp. YH-ols2216]MDJ1129452.1 glycyl radical protein [Olsenella sp. YH-ols2217]
MTVTAAPQAPYLSFDNTQPQDPTELFGALTPRMQEFREEVLSEKPYIDAERALLATEAYEQSKSQPQVMRRARMLSHILDHMTVYIEDKTLIAGNQATKNRNAPVFPEYTLEFVMNELDLFEKRDGDVFYITDQTKDQIRSVAPFWENNNLRSRGEALLPEEVQVYMETGLFGMEGKLNAGDAHLAVNHRRVLAEGLAGYERRAREASAALDLTDPASIDKRVFYNAVLETIAAVKRFSERYAALAREQAATATPERASELLAIADRCERVPYEPARTFAEALQAVWMLQVVLQIESNGHSLSYGRMDQYVWPYLQADLEAGRITEQEALELLGNLWIKTLTINKVRSQTHTLSSAGSPMYQNVTIGGQRLVDGEPVDAVNPLSYLILQSVAQTRLTQPNLTVRYHHAIDPHFLDLCVEVWRLGFGMPAMNNDEVIVPSFIQWGVAREDAYDYSAIGCVETAVPGKWGYRCTGMSYLNFPRLLLCTMNGGVDLTTGKRFAQDYGRFTEMTSFDQLMGAWDKTIRELTRASVIVENAIDLASERDVPDVLCSALTDDCIGRGKTIKEGGAVYDFISGLQVGIANMADSLAALKKVVFEDERLTTQQVWDALVSDFAGEEGEAVRQALMAGTPRYGNDDDYVDSLAVEAYDPYIDEVAKYHSTRFGRGPIGGIRYAGTSSISANVGQGMGTMATPDGRHAHEPLAEGCSPAHNADQNGPTAVFKSITKLPTEKITGGVLLNQKMTPAMLAKPQNKQKLKMMLGAYFNRLHGYHVQFNVVSRETLLDAQEHPEKHRDLIVRVAGYSAFFNDLSRATQDDIIGRTEQSL